MPIYDYLCSSCGTRSEFMHGVNEAGPATCPACGGGPLRKAISPPAIVFKGTGWAKKERSRASAPRGDGDAAKDKDGSAKEPKPTDTAKSEPAKDSASSAGAD